MESGIAAVQDAIKKTSKDELPDFYNIQLERPKDDDKGYDVLFIDAASKVRPPAVHSCSLPCTMPLQLMHRGSHGVPALG